jgi:hypothetical protein
MQQHYGVVVVEHLFPKCDDILGGGTPILKNETELWVVGCGR